MPWWAWVLLGVTFGALGAFLWLAWFFRDMFR